MIDAIFGADLSAELSAVERYAGEVARRRAELLRDVAEVVEACFNEGKPL